MKRVASLCIGLLAITWEDAARAAYFWPTDSMAIREDFGPTQNAKRSSPVQGIEIDAPFHALVRTVEAGRVLHAPPIDFPGVVEVLLDNGRIVRYAYLDELLVTEGQRVELSPTPWTIGQVGNVGTKDGTTDYQLGIFFGDFKHPLIDLPYNDTQPAIIQRFLKKVKNSWVTLANNGWACDVGVEVNTLADKDLNSLRLTARRVDAPVGQFDAMTTVNYNNQLHVTDQYVLPQAVGDDYFVFLDLNSAAGTLRQRYEITAQADDAGSQFFATDNSITVGRECDKPFIKKAQVGDKTIFQDGSPTSDTTVSGLRPRIIITLDDELSGVNPDSIEFYVDGAVAEWQPYAMGSYTFYHDPPSDLPEGERTLRVVAQDNAGNEMDTSVRFGIADPLFLVENPTPTVRQVLA